MDLRKVKFVGFGDNSRICKSLIFRLLSRHFALELSESPDYVFFNSGGEHFRYNDCIKIVVQGENQTVDFNAYDYGIGFDHMIFGDRYLRNPLFARYPLFETLSDVRMDILNRRDELVNRKFCSFVVSHQAAGDPMREMFFRRLSQYKHVDSGGRFLNNVGGPVEDKIAFCRQYKFNIAFENSSSPGYTTEKIMDAYASISLPIYYGNPSIETDFSPASMIRLMSEDDIESAVDEVVRLDNDDDEYMRRLAEPCLVAPDIGFYERQLDGFLMHVFNQPKCMARRRNKYGCQAVVACREAKIYKTYYSIVNSLPYALARRTYGWFLKMTGRE